MADVAFAHASSPLADEASSMLEAEPPKPWSPLTRVLFRTTFVYLLLFIFFCGNGSIFQYWGSAGQWIDTKLMWPLMRLSEWVSVHLFHNTGLAASFHDTGSGDTVMNWVLVMVELVLALMGGLVWTAIAIARGNRRVEYTTAYAWLRFLLRLSAGMFMMSYGLAKLIPLQMAPISIAVLNEPVGNMSPMTMLWSLIGLNPLYEIVCGAAEVLGGVLILFRRTALLGALLSAFVMTNVLLYNLFFDVPVKLFAANLLLALLFITLPDVPALFRFFWLHQPAAPAGVWIPPAERRSFRMTTRLIEIIFVATFLLWMPMSAYMSWKKHLQAIRAGSPLVGAWQVEDRVGRLEGPEHDAITMIYVDDPTRAFARGMSGVLWRTWMSPNLKAGTVKLGVYGNDPYTFQMNAVDADHFVLAVVAPKDPKTAKNFKPLTVALTRIPLPSHYPLLDRGFHWVNEWGLER